MNGFAGFQGNLSEGEFDEVSVIREVVGKVGNVVIMMTRRNVIDFHHRRWDLVVLYRIVFEGDISVLDV